MEFIDFFSPNTVLGRGMIALLLLSLLTAPIGCFIVWRRMSFFGATLAHSSLLGAILGIWLGLNVFNTLLAFTVVLALLLQMMLRQRILSADTLLGMMAHFTLALGFIFVSMTDDLRIDLTAYLFGDLLGVQPKMLPKLAILTAIALCLLSIFQRGFLNLCITPSIAQVEGYAVGRLELMFVLLLSITISIGLQAVGVLLILSLLIIPAATARLITHSVRAMVLFAWLITLFCAVIGIFLAYQLDLPAGAAVVCLTGIIFIITKLMTLFLRS